jgi:DedD protein
LVANVADKAIEKAPIKVELPAMPDVPSRPEPIALAVAPTDPPTSTPQPARAGSETKPQAVSAKRQWFVQVGAFAKEANAHNVRAKLEAVGLASAAEPSDTPAGRLRRVRVGPFDAKGEAERAALQVKALDLPAVLVRQ